jgi:hypothetical protein
MSRCRRLYPETVSVGGIMAVALTPLGSNNDIDADFSFLSFASC